MTIERGRHPSGRPRREIAYGRLPIIRPPRDGYLTPGLRDRRNLADAIGFHAHIRRDSADEDSHG